MMTIKARTALFLVYADDDALNGKGGFGMTQLKEVSV